MSPPRVTSPPSRSTTPLRPHHHQDHLPITSPLPRPTAQPLITSPLPRSIICHVPMPKTSSPCISTTAKTNRPVTSSPTPPTQPPIISPLPKCATHHTPTISLPFPNYTDNHPWSPPPRLITSYTSPIQKPLVTSPPPRPTTHHVPTTHHIRATKANNLDNLPSSLTLRPTMHHSPTTTANCPENHPPRPHLKIHHPPCPHHPKHPPPVSLPPREQPTAAPPPA